MLFLFAFANLPGLIQADEQAKIVSLIKNTGASFRLDQSQIEIGFHLKGRQSAKASLPLVGSLQNVVWLNLANSNVTDDSLSHLKNLKRLRSLHLEKTSVGDAGIKHLTGLRELEYLNLYSTKITDASLDQLAQLPKLRKLYIWQTSTTDEGIKRLAAVRPRLKIVRGTDLTQLSSKFPTEKEDAKPKIKLDFVSVERRDEAPARSDNGVNCQVWFENQSGEPVKLYWISYGAGQLKMYATLQPKEIRKQNSYSRNAWLITDTSDRPLGYFIAKDDDARAIIPKLEK